MRVGILGATGFVGRHLIRRLNARGDDVVTASLREPEDAARNLASCDAVVNLAGETISQRWSAAVKHNILYSRTQLPQRFLEAIGTFPAHPAVYISASAIGYYGTSDTATFTEDSPPGDDFLARVCIAWEREAVNAQMLGMRVAIVRTGVALGDGGALGQMLAPFKLGAGGVIGDGRQWVSWVHVEDVAGIYLQAIDGASGVFNATAPNPVTNAQFTQALGRAVHRPTILPTPTFALRMLLGEGADLLLTGQRVLPQRTQAEGYAFRFTEIDDALANAVA
ncbi:MAG: TIGR01777 family oxidoreductase [Candidatus Eremiobacteraeota bacterium]|nr:TIGR01777 family oxidoreductase [Candidatus Eremiobacteraeota bacterium]